MKKYKFEINIFSLSEGSNRIELRLQPEEIGLESIFLEKNIECTVILNKTKSEVSLEGEITFALKLECSRCFKPFTLKKTEKLSAYFEKKHTKKMETEHLSQHDVITEYYENDTINIKPILHDTIALSIPMKPLCDTECKGLCPICGANLNIEKCNCKIKKTDPRWDQLKKLIEKS
jgi:uncharacterized protein